MATDDWYRSNGWSKIDQQIFDDKITRSRSSSHRQQYARIKALSLIGTEKKDKIYAAIDLLHKSLREWCEDWMAKEEAHEALGEAYRKLGEYEKASDSYEASIGWHENLIHRAYWDYPEMIVTHGLTDKYHRAYEIVNRVAAENDLVLEEDKFIHYAVRAIVLNHDGQTQQAQTDALAALSIAKVKRSIFRYHTNVGLVNAKKHKRLIKQLKEI